MVSWSTATTEYPTDKDGRHQLAKPHDDEARGGPPLHGEDGLTIPPAARSGAPSFAALLKELRGQRKLSQRELCRRSGIPFAYISKIETGANAPPSEPVIRALAATLRVDGDELTVAAGKFPEDLRRSLTDPRLVKELRGWLARAGSAGAATEPGEPDTASAQATD